MHVVITVNTYCSIPDYNYIIQNWPHCCVSVATLLINSSHFGAELENNGCTDMCVKDNKYPNAPYCCVIDTLPVFFLHTSTFKM